MQFANSNQNKITRGVWIEASILYALIFGAFVDLVSRSVEAAAGPGDTFRIDRALAKPKAGVALAELGILHRQMGARLHRIFPAIGNLQIIHYHYFSGASATLTINSGDILFTYFFVLYSGRAT